jgi:integrase
MRRGEVLGLRWQDIDWDHGRLAVRQTVVLVGYNVTFSTPKTAKGRRSIALDKATLEALRLHRELQKANRPSLGIGYRDQDLVLAAPDGSPINPDQFSQVFDRKVAKLDVPRIRLHDLRHTHATLGLAAGVPPKIMSERLGHSTVAFTQDVYVHSIPRMEEEAADQVASLIFGSDLNQN